MKLLANLDCATPPLTGIGHYTRQLACRLAHHPQVETLKGRYRNRWIDGTQLPHWLEHQDATTAPAEGWQVRLRHHLRQVPGSYPLRHWLRRARFSRAVRPYGDHLYWEPGLELGPFAGQRVATLYDLSHLVTPESHPPARVAYLGQQIEHTIRHADRLVTISHTMRRDIARHAGLDEATIGVVPPAAGAAFRPRPARECRSIRHQLGLPERYILTVGTLEPRKNLLRLAKAYAALPDAIRQMWPLVCVGGKGWGTGELVRTLERLERRGELIRMGYVAQETLPLITAAAGLVAYPSRYEGFGMPVVEAMASGVAVMTSRGTAMQEITGDGAFLVNPLDEDDLRETLIMALTDDTTRQTLAAAGPSTASRYDWDSSTDAMVAVFNADTDRL